MSAVQLPLADEGVLAPHRFERTTSNRSKRVAVITRAPWESDSWRSMSRVGRYIRFVETFCVAPVARRLIKLHPYQRGMFERLLDPATRQGVEKIPRGNAKTTTVGALITAGMFLEPDHDVPIVATTIKQAKQTTYGAVVSMTSKGTGHDELAGRCLQFTGVQEPRIEVPGTNSKCYPHVDHAKALQGLNPSIGVLDEMSEAELATWDALVLASGKRPDSVIVGISTPSFRIAGNAMLDVERALAAGAQIPGISMHEHMAPLGCDHRDEANWFIANPGLSTDPPILYIDALRADVHKEQSFRCYRLAQWPDRILDGWLGEDGSEVWDALADPWSFVSRARTWVGVDVSLRHDSTAVVAVQERADGRWHAKARIWYPSIVGGIVDQADVREYLRELSVDYELAGVAYDPRYFVASAQDLEAEGLPMVEVPQTAPRMIPAVAAAFKAIRSRRLTHDGDPVFGQHVLNAEARPSAGGFTIEKSNSSLKIDGCLALCLAMSLADTREPEYTDETWSVL